MDFDVVIIGAGVVGLAVGKSLVKVTTNACIIDQNQSYGMETSSRNSEVIHSGIYYPKNSFLIVPPSLHLLLLEFSSHLMHAENCKF